MVRRGGNMFQRIVCLTLAVSLALVGAPLHVMAQEDPGPGDQTTPAPTDPEKPPQAPEKPPEVPQPDPVKPPEATPEAPKIQGKLLDLDGKTPIPNEQVRVVDKDGTQILEVTSGPDGGFVLPTLKDGDYVIETRGVRQPLQVRPDQPIRELTILVPAAQFQPAGPVPAKDEDDSSILIFVGVGVAVIVAGVAAGVTIAVVNGSDDGDDTFIGPTSNEGPTAPGVPATSQLPPGTVPAPLVREVAFAPGTTGNFGATTPGQNPAIPVTINNSTGNPFTAVGTVTGAGFGFLPGGAGGAGAPARTTAEVGRVAPAVVVPGQSAFIPGFGQVTFWVGFEGSTPGTFTGVCTITTPNGPITLTLTIIVNNTGPFSAYTP